MVLIGYYVLILRSTPQAECNLDQENGDKICYSFNHDFMKACFTFLLELQLQLPVNSIGPSFGFGLGFAAF